MSAYFVVMDGIKFNLNWYTTPQTIVTLYNETFCTHNMFHHVDMNTNLLLFVRATFFKNPRIVFLYQLHFK